MLSTYKSRFLSVWVVAIFAAVFICPCSGNLELGNTIPTIDGSIEAPFESLLSIQKLYSISTSPSAINIYKNREIINDACEVSEFGSFSCTLSEIPSPGDNLIIVIRDSSVIGTSDNTILVARCAFDEDAYEANGKDCGTVNDATTLASTLMQVSSRADSETELYEHLVMLFNTELPNLQGEPFHDDDHPMIVQTTREMQDYYYDNFEGGIVSLAVRRFETDSSSMKDYTKFLGKHINIFEEEDVHTLATIEGVLYETSLLDTVVEMAIESGADPLKSVLSISKTAISLMEIEGQSLDEVVDGMTSGENLPFTRELLKRVGKHDKKCSLDSDINSELIDDCHSLWKLDGATEYWSMKADTSLPEDLLSDMDKMLKCAYKNGKKFDLYDVVRSGANEDDILALLDWKNKDCLEKCEDALGSYSDYCLTYGIIGNSLRNGYFGYYMSYLLM